ncbi:MAG: response regulator [Desulfobacula sp.]|jgi:DNA-binding NtrC family response regulator|uniref:response regulator n=1 Tax=Desulfobacula sp. TaxID=2593537 RepID=UPI001D879733|nr:response regulator [Desulfobacula sp.]MBT3807121.1 response regulator [Desulfobacula sp.]MBT6338400.1 response regulator [Desulfobacula sp.]MBT6751307.1 response regulator [Desulfobacula sp.]
MIGSKILLVDDEEIFADNMAKLLQNRQYKVTAVYNGESAIKALEKENFDVIVLDLKMPGMNGIATLKKIKNLGLFTETLLLTGHGSVESAIEALRMGAYDFLAKPCEIDDLVEKIEGAWRKKDQAWKKDMEEKLKRVVESPSDAFKLFD